MSRIIAIPSKGPELSDHISAHFGHSNYFVGIKIDDKNNYEKIFSFKNQKHSGCKEHVKFLKEKGVSYVVVGGIGGNPFNSLLYHGIKLYKGIEGTLKENIKSFLDGNLETLLGPSCHGSSNKCHAS